MHPKQFSLLIYHYKRGFFHYTVRSVEIQRCSLKQSCVDLGENMVGQKSIYKIFLVTNVEFDFSSVQISCSVVSDCLWPHELQHARPPCPSSTPGVYPKLCPLSQWCHPTILSSVIPFSSHPQSFPASGSFQMSQLFASGG